MRFLLTLALIITASCSLFKTGPKEDNDFDRYVDLRAAHRLWLEDLHAQQHPETQWPVNDCDAWVWAGKAAAAGARIDLSLSEYPGEPGRFGRRPPIAGKWCWQDGEDYGSASTWSADMFKCGMLIYALQQSDLAILEAHAEYGRENGWKMGDPASRDEVYYKPNIRGWLARAIDYLGGSYDNDALIPDVYVAGLTDYKAHLQMCGVWAYAEIGNGQLLPSQIQRIREHFERSPQTLFYAFMHGRWVSGDLDPVTDALLADPVSAGEYVRCGGRRDCHLAEKAWVASLILRMQP